MTLHTATLISSQPKYEEIYYQTRKWHAITEPPNDKTNKMKCGPSDVSDQPGHLPSLIRVFASHSMASQDPMFPHADS